MSDHGSIVLKAFIDSTMRWIYILQCHAGFFYVGTTSRLYRRFWEHLSGNGGVNTAIHPPEKIVAVYPVNRLGKFFDYSTKVRNGDYNLGYNIYFDRGGVIEAFNDGKDEEGGGYDSIWIENVVVEKMMSDNASIWKSIRGGKYVRSDVEYPFPRVQVARDLPNCNCGLPCDVVQHREQPYLYFRCAKKNMWGQMRDELGIDDEPCAFFMKYTHDSQFRPEYEARKTKLKSLTSRSYWLKQALGLHEHCIGGCGRPYDGDYTIRYERRAINLCFDCFLDKYNELAARYKKERVRLLPADDAHLRVLGEVVL